MNIKELKSKKEKQLEKKKIVLEKKKIVLKSKKEKSDKACIIC